MKYLVLAMQHIKILPSPTKNENEILMFSYQKYESLEEILERRFIGKNIQHEF